MDSKYLSFRQIGDTGKTKVYAVVSVSRGLRLGTIKWYGQWRQYTFWPEGDTIWNTQCLRDINAFIDKLMAERKSSVRS